MDSPGFGCCVDPVWVGPEWVLSGSSVDPVWVLSGPYMLSAICYEWALYAKCYMLVLCAMSGPYMLSASTIVVHQCQATSMSICGPMPVAAGGVG